MPALEVASGFGTDWGAGGFGAATAGRSGAAFRWTCSGACCEAAGRGVGIAGLGAGEAGADGRGVPDAAAACMCTAGCVALAEDAATRPLDGVCVEAGGWAGFDVALAAWVVAVVAGAVEAGLAAVAPPPAPHPAAIAAAPTSAKPAMAPTGLARVVERVMRIIGSSGYWSGV